MIAGRYSLEREVGRGGMGAVWLGRDEVLGRRVALKRLGLLPDTDGTDLARAEREAQLAARLNHPHVVSVFNYAVDPASGDRWLVMEYVEGTTLARLVRDRAGLPTDEAARLLGQVADALVAAHAAGIVHRDVKPSNILVDGSGQAKLADFGIARIATDATLTQSGMLIGSPAYLAPEVAAGARSDQAADVWSLGATCFYALSGRAPYPAGDNVLGALYRIVNDEPPRLPDAGRLAPLLAGTLVKDPAQRWPMTQVRDFLAGRTTAPAPPSAPTRAATTAPAPEPPTTHRRRLVAAAAVATLAVLALVLVPVLLLGHGSGPSAAGRNGAPARSAGPTGGARPTPTQHPPHPTAAGMSSFIRRYVATVGADPRSAWQMLTPRFQRASGGLDTYLAFWDPARNGRVLSISADPRTMTVSYHVHFDHFHNGPGPTVLGLVLRDDRYLIDAEHTKGFTPAH